MVYFRTADDLRFCTVRFHIVTEHLTHQCNIRTASSQKCGCFKCTHTCLIHKIIRVDHNTSIETACLQIRNLNIIHNILQNFRNHLARRRRIRFNVRQQRIVNIITALSVMVKHNDRLRNMKQFFTFCHTRAVRIHNNYHRTLICEFQRFCRI